MSAITLKTDINSPVFRATHYGEHSEDGIADRVYDEVGGGELGDLAASAARGGLSFGRDATKLSLGPVGMLVMPLDEAGKETYTALKNGESPGDALAKSSKRGLVDAAETVYRVPEIFEPAVEDMLLGKESDYRRIIMELQNKGMSPTEAKQKAFKELFAESVSKQIAENILRR